MSIDLDYHVWLLVFLRVSAFLLVLPFFSMANFPVTLRVALSALTALLLAPLLPPFELKHLSYFSLIGVMVQEVSIGLLMGFLSRMVFYAADLAGNVVASEMGLNLASVFNPVSGQSSQAPGTILFFLAAVVMFTLDLHHWVLVGFERTYDMLPIGGAHLSAAVFEAVVKHTSRIFMVALQISAPVIAVSFVITLVFSVLSRVVPQMNVFTESFSFRIVGGLIVFGFTLQLTAQHVLNYLRRLPDDLLGISQMLYQRLTPTMSEQHGEKTEQPTQKRIDEALKKGQIARSPEVQTVFVLFGALAALSFAGREIWQNLAGAAVGTLGHLHDTTLSNDALQGYAVSGTLLFIKCAGPVTVATALAGLLAGAVQNRFNTASEALNPDWNRLNPVEGFKRIFSFRMWIMTAMAVGKLAFIIALTYSEVSSILSDPIFTTSVSVGRMAEFLAGAWMRIFFRITLALLVVAAADYGYQLWRTHQDLMMTKEELKEESKSTDGNPQIKAARRRRRSLSKAKMLAEVPKADVIVTNPTHIAVALRYDRKTMRAPKVVAKGIRLNAERIREIARQHQVPILENKPLARMLFKHGRVGGEVPAQFYAAVAEVLAWVYRINRYRYYTESNQV